MKPHKLTKKEAFQIISAIHDDYLHNQDAGDVHVQGKHRAEIMAEGMIREGLPGLSTELMQVHNTLISASKGDFKRLAYFAEVPVADNLEKEAAGTKFANGAREILNPIRRIEEALSQRNIDWEKSSPVLVNVKKITFPETLTMVEKLALWKPSPTTGKSTER